MTREQATVSSRRSRARRLAPLLAPLALAAALAGAAVVTVEKAGCDDPGAYVTTSKGVEFVGGCLAPGDLPGTPNLGPAGDARG